MQGTEYLEIFEHTQRARGNHKDNWVHTLLPLLNKQCKAVVMCLPAASKTKYKLVKQEILATASPHTKQASKAFWEHGKKQGTTWREEASTLMKQLKKFTAGPTIEQIRQQIATEKLLQMLPGKAQAFVREREPSTPTEAADLASSYFSSHNMDELQWENYKDFPKKANHKDRPHKFNTPANQKYGYQNLPHDKSHLQQSYQQPRANNQPHRDFKGNQNSNTRVTSQSFTQQPTDLSQIICFKCGDKGHKSN